MCTGVTRKENWKEEFNPEDQGSDEDGCPKRKGREAWECIFGANKFVEETRDGKLKKSDWQMALKITQHRYELKEKKAK